MRFFLTCICLLGLSACASNEPVRRHARPRRARAPRSAPAATGAVVPAARSFYTPAPGAPSATPAPPSSPPSATVDPRCREVLQRNEEQLARIARRASCGGVAVAALRESFGACAQVPGGTWAPEIVDARDRGEGDACELLVSWRVMLFHPAGVTEEGHDSMGRVERSFRVVASGDEAQEYARITLTASDLDDDRAPELVVSETVEDHSARRARTAIEVYTASQGAVRVYEPTRAMVLLGADDVDDDGRVDFFVPSPYVWTEGAECGLGLVHEPLTLLAHALPNGGFSTRDEVAARHLRQACPAREAPHGDDPPDPAGLAIACRRLWGAAPDEALAPLRCERFRSPPSTRCEGTARRLPPLEAGECPAHYDAWAHMPPPLLLR